MPSAERSRPRRRASVSTARPSLVPSTSTTPRGCIGASDHTDGERGAQRSLIPWDTTPASTQWLPTPGESDGIQHGFLDELVRSDDCPEIILERPLPTTARQAAGLCLQRTPVGLPAAEMPRDEGEALVPAHQEVAAARSVNLA